MHGIFGQDVYDQLCDKGVKEVYVLEGRPALATGRHACRELLRRNIQPVIIADNMAGFLFYKKSVKEVWLSCLSKSDHAVLCRAGGLILGVLGHTHQIPVYVYSGTDRSEVLGNTKDIAYFNGKKVAPNGISGYVPLIEWVPAKYIRKIYG
jgi:methylthioribose-1-phosphate isomerase